MLVSNFAAYARGLVVLSSGKSCRLSKYFFPSFVLTVALDWGSAAVGNLPEHGL
jgi:hypothetical protein